MRRPNRIGERLTDDLELLECIGAGGFGEVYCAYQASLDRQVAVKLVRPERSLEEKTLRRFQREAHALSRLAHPHIVSTYGQGETEDGELYLAMELLTGRPLSAVLEDDGQLPPERVVEIAGQLANALSAAHDAGVIHRDLKPANIFVRHDVGLASDFVTVLDFGLAALNVNDETASYSHDTAGTAHYMSPERVLGDTADPRADLYALGVVMFEMLTGRRPFDGGGSLVRIMMKQVNEQVPDVRELAPETPIWLGHLVARLLAKEPAHRPNDAATVAALLAAQDSGCSPAEDIPSHPVDARSSQWRWMAVAVAGLVAVATAWLVLGSSPRGLDIPAVVVPIPFIAANPSPALQSTNTAARPVSHTQSRPSPTVAQSEPPEPVIARVEEPADGRNYRRPMAIVYVRDAPERAEVSEVGAKGRRRPSKPRAKVQRVRKPKITQPTAPVSERVPVPTAVAPPKTQPTRRAEDLGGLSGP